MPKCSTWYGTGVPYAGVCPPRISNPEQRAEILIAVAFRLEVSERPTALAHALTAIQQLEGELEQAEMLMALAPQLTPELARQALTTTRSIASDERRAEILIALTPIFAEGPQRQALLTDALATVQSIVNGSQRTRLQAALAPQLDHSLVLQILRSAGSVRDEKEQLQLLTTLLPCIPSSQRPAIFGYTLAGADKVLSDNTAERATNPIDRTIH